MINFSQYNAIGTSNLWKLQPLQFKTFTPIGGGTIATHWNNILGQVLHKTLTETNLLILVGEC
jgi:hypothetical protein